MISIFKLVIAVIITIIVLSIVFNLFPPQEQDALANLRAGLDFAEANENELHHAEIFFKQNFAASGKLFDGPTRNVRFECSNTETCGSGKAIITARTMIINEQMLIDVYFRCKKQGIISDCVIYLGEQPSKIEATLIGYGEKVLLGEPNQVVFKVENTGLLDAVNIAYDGIVFEKKSVNGEEQLLAVDEFSGTIDRLTQGNSKTITEQFTLNASGKYLLRITVDGEDAGRDTIEEELNVERQISASCNAVAKGTTFLENGMCRTEYTCTGCEFGYECAVQWEKNGLTELEIGDKEKVYTEKEPVNGSCN